MSLLLQTLCFHLGMTEAFVWDYGEPTEFWTDTHETESILSKIHDEIVKDKGSLLYSHKVSAMMADNHWPQNAMFSLVGFCDFIKCSVHKVRMQKPTVYLYVTLKDKWIYDISVKTCLWICTVVGIIRVHAQCLVARAVPGSCRIGTIHVMTGWHKCCLNQGLDLLYVAFCNCYL